MTGVGRYAVTVTLPDHESTSGLLSLVTVLHRRAVTVAQVELSPASQGRHIFNATFTATEHQAATVRASLDNLIDTLEVVLGEPIETPVRSTIPDQAQAGTAS